jgi:DNA-binding LytR/AlgR family response regulator
MNIIIIEDEQLAIERLKILIKQYDASINIIGCLETIEEAIHWFKTHEEPDLILMDIHLSDGHSFEIFKKINIVKPLIFTTAYDQYAIEAFQHFSIDYLLKPISKEMLSNAFEKYKSIVNSVTPPNFKSWQKLIGSSVQNLSPYKNRFVAKVGIKSFVIQTVNIAYFTADNKIVRIIDTNDNIYSVNHTIEKIESMVNPADFFKINRSTIINQKMIQQIKPHLNNRLKLTLKCKRQLEELIVSRERVSAFKNWLEEESVF